MDRDDRNILLAKVLELSVLPMTDDSRKVVAELADILCNRPLSASEQRELGRAILFLFQSLNPSDLSHS